MRGATKVKLVEYCLQSYIRKVLFTFQQFINCFKINAI